MLDINQLSVVKPHEVEAGTVLLGGAQYSDAAMMVFDWGQEIFWFEFSGGRAFQGKKMAVNLNSYILAGDATLLVDVDTKISPTRSDIPMGSVVLMGKQACFATRLNHGTAYVGIDGHLIDDPKSYEKMVAFPRWQLVVPKFGIDKWKVVHDAGGK